MWFKSKSMAAKFTRAELDAAGYGSLVVGQKSWNVVALLDRRSEPTQIRRALPSDAKDV